MRIKATGSLPTAGDKIRMVPGALIVADLIFGPDGVLTGIEFRHQYNAIRRERDGRTTLICPDNRAA